MNGIHDASTTESGRYWADRIGERALLIRCEGWGGARPPKPLVCAVELNGIADVVTLHGDAITAFNEKAGEPYRVFGGVVRAVAESGETWYWPAPKVPAPTAARKSAAWLRSHSTAPIARPSTAPAVKPAPRTTVAAADPWDSSGWFDDWRERLDFDIHIAWAKRIPAASKSTYPLPERWLWMDGIDKDIESAEVSRRTVLDACVEALTGLDKTMPSRQLHTYGNRVTGSPLTGPWGYPVWRSSLTAGAGGWRLHYTRTDTGLICFLDVSHHDAKPRVKGRTCGE